MAATFSPLVITIWVSRLAALRPITTGSKLSRHWPTFTLSPFLVLQTKPSPFRVTVSRPMWTSTSMPLPVVMARAWWAPCNWVTVPATGASTSVEVGSMETPSPTIFPANTGSGTVSMGTRTPERGAKMVRVAAAVAGGGSRRAGVWAGVMADISLNPSGRSGHWNHLGQNFLRNG